MIRMNKKIRGAVVVRSRGRCEACGAFLSASGCGDTGHTDHFFGRAKAPESPENCWQLCIACDAKKTTGRPSAAFWLSRFIAHCKRHGFIDEKIRAEVKLAVLVCKGFA